MESSEFQGKKCPYCQTSILPGQKVLSCPECGMPHHAECWDANGGCTTYGCSQMPKAGSVVSRSDTLDLYLDQPDNNDFTGQYATDDGKSESCGCGCIFGIIGAVVLGSSFGLAGAIIGFFIGLIIGNAIDHMFFSK